VSGKIEIEKICEFEVMAKFVIKGVLKSDCFVEKGFSDENEMYDKCSVDHLRKSDWCMKKLDKSNEHDREKYDEPCQISKIAEEEDAKTVQLVGSSGEDPRQSVMQSEDKRDGEFH